MSATINSGKLKFSVFGNGFEETRNDSGSGALPPSTYGWGVRNAVIDSTGTYVWLNFTGYGHTSGLYKYKINGLEEVSQPVTTGGINAVFQPTNIANNYGLVIQGTNWYVFDLTTDEIIQSGTNSNLSIYQFLWDCILIDSRIYIIQCSLNRTSPKIFWFDIESGNSGYYEYTSNICCVGFVGNNLIYNFQTPVWFTDYLHMYAYNLSGSQIWDIIGSSSGSSGMPNISVMGFGGNNNLYLPTLKNGKWRLGRYSALSAPDVFTPSPSKVVGEFPSKPSLITAYVAQNVGRTKACFATDIGTYYTDYNDMYLVPVTVSSGNPIPLAINDDYIIMSTSVENYLYVIPI